jgi:uncharacterized protein (TIGR03435 family)
VDIIPHLNELVKKFSRRPVQFISITNEEKNVVEKFLKKRPIAGWVGFDPGSTLAKAYGLQGVPSTVLISPDGKVAGITHPKKLKSEHLESLLAGKELKLPSMSFADMSILRTSLEPGPSANLDIIIRPSSDKAYGKTFGPGRYQWKGMSLRELLSDVYEIPPMFVEGNALDDQKHYDVSAVGPKDQGPALKKLLPDLLAIAFDVTTKREMREIEGWALTAPSGKPKGLKETTSMGGMSKSGYGTFEMAGFGMTQVAHMMQHVLRKPIVDKTGIDGRFDLSLQYEEMRPESLMESLREFGFDFEPSKVQTEFLVVNER